MSHQPTSSSRGPKAAPSKSVMQATSKFCQIMLPGRESPHESTTAVSGGMCVVQPRERLFEQGGAPPRQPLPQAALPHLELAAGTGPDALRAQHRQIRIVDVRFMDPGQGPQSLCNELGPFGRRGLDEESAPGVRGVLARYVPGDVAHDEEGCAQDLRIWFEPEAVGHRNLAATSERIHHRVLQEDPRRRVRGLRRIDGRFGGVAPEHELFL